MPTDDEDINVILERVAPGKNGMPDIRIVHAVNLGEIESPT